MWEPEPGIKLSDAYYKITEKVTNRRWKEFARKGLRLDENVIDEIVADNQGSVKEQKIKMCRRWEESFGSKASVDLIYQVLNNFLFPKKCPAPDVSRKVDPEEKISKDPGNGDGPMVSLSNAGCGQEIKAVVIDDRGIEEYCSSVTDIVVEPCNQAFFDEHNGHDSVYGTSGRKGNILIINNTFSYHQNKHREGSKVDAKNMAALWKKMGCKVTVRDDLYADDIMSQLKNFSDQSEGYDYCVVFIMSHGNSTKGEDVVFGNDEKQIRVQSIFDMFNNKNCPHLISVPKLFFFQCCRGSVPDSGVHVADGTMVEPVDEEPHPSAPMLPDSVTIGGSNPSEAREETDANPNDPDRLPIVSDMLMFYATQAGNQAFRNTVHGSWFVNAIANVFMRRAKNEHILDLMVQVNQAVAAKSASGAASNCKEMSHIECNLRKKLYLYPGIQI